MQYYLSKCFNRIPNVYSKSQYAKNQLEWCLRAHNLYIELLENFEYALKSADRPMPTAVFHINRSRQKYSYGLPAGTHTKWENKLEGGFQISQNHLISQREN